MASLGSASPPRSPRRSAELDAANQLAQDIDAARQMSRARLNSQAPHPHSLFQHARGSSSTSTVNQLTPNNYSSNLAIAGTGSGGGGGDELPDILDADTTPAGHSHSVLRAGGGSTDTAATTPGASMATPVPIPDASRSVSGGRLQDLAPLSTSPSRQYRPQQLHSASAGGFPGSAGGGAGASLFPHQPMSGGNRPSSRSPGSAAVAANLTYFYRHNRHGSNTSLDSSQHFIDHRQQPHSISLNPHSPIINRQASVSVQQQQHARSPVAFRRGFFDHGPGGSAGGMSGDQDGAGITMESPMGGPGAYLPSPTGPLIDISTDTVGQGGTIRRRLSGARRSTHSGKSPRDAKDDDGVMYGERGSPHTVSRRPSMLEDDVCFPMLPDSSAHPHGYHDEHEAQAPVYHQHHEDVYHHHPDADVPGDDAYRLPPGFPFTFDLRVLEEFASEERDRASTVPVGNEPYQSGLDGTGQASGAMPINATSPGTGGLRNRLGRPSIPTSSAANLYGASPDSDDATFYVRKPKKMPASAAAGSHVAGVFNANHPSARASPRLQGQDSSANLFSTASEHAKAKAPLLDGKNGLPTYGADNQSSDARSTKSAKAAMARSQSHAAMSLAAQDSVHQRGRAGSTPGGGSLPTGAALYAAQQVQSQQERPYRFTFYSNALPSTIHARYLSEIPAPGQSFEELFGGHKPAMSTPNPPQNASAGAEGSTAGGHPNGLRSGNGSGTDLAGGGGLSAAGVGAPGPLSRPNSTLPHTAGAPLPLPAHMLQQTGRMEGNTAPPTGANTPILAQHALPMAPRTGGVLGLTAAAGGPPSVSTARTGAALGAGAASGNGNRVPSASQAAAASRTYPGGGLRMDQDADANTWWLDVLCPTDAEMKLLSRVFGVHPLTTEDILMEETREKIELFRNYFLVCFRSFDQDPHSASYLEPVNMYIIVFREGTLSFHFHPTPHPQNVRRRIKQLKDYISVTSDWISYALIDDITDAFGPLIQNIEYEVDSIDELVLILKDVEQSDMLRRIGMCRKKVMGLLRLMGNKADVVKGLAKRCNENWSVAPKSDIGLYLSDIQDHLITMTQNLNHYEKILSRSHSNYLAQISIEMTDANNQINDVLSKLTALGTIIVPMNVITGLWGMNVNVPGQGVENLHWFAGICAVLAFLAISGYYATIRYLQRS
ncbi:unnamed protein product [Tilletia controversa]|uniref:Cora-domain-containing protein n=3 Tax=Tilletia TaxID=13289 RepID=A0A8X7MUY2_9BASI|nr:hypothetical protein CF336_g3498 [Tilletia laevis]KAE8199639.1 hypothetical protein CF328_g3192 [Tilletia controversa]KAE8253365.1 hypothetical protein A4X03_0g5918 [Tilletia caries]KAE8204465.1 hypothetical protein CF335_g2646 [Tilletia laevis]KAE8248162.1 hypothetical protein A4X06_0g3913 [Tilletia controversa]